MMTATDRLITFGTTFAGIGLLLAVFGFDLFTSGVVFGMGLALVIFAVILANRRNIKEIDLSHKDDGNGRDK